MLNLRVVWAVLRAAVEPYDLTRASAATGLSSSELDDFVAAIRRHGTIAAQTGTGVTFSPNGSITEWLVWALSIITGSYDRPGGMWFNPGFFKQLDRRDLPISDSPAKGPGPASRPDLPNIIGEMPGAAFADEIEAGNIRAAVICGLNPITSYPDAARQAAALAALDVVLVADLISGRLTDLATHVAPVAGALERADLTAHADFLMVDVSAGHTRAVVPLGGRAQTTVVGACPTGERARPRHSRRRHRSG